MVNVLNPTIHRAANQTTVSLTFVNGSCSFIDDDIILDTFAIADKTENTHYALSYDFGSSRVTVSALNNGVTGTVNATYYKIDTSVITTADIIGSAANYTGIYAVKRMFTDLNAVPNLLNAPYWSEFPDVYAALVAVSQRINNHWFAYNLGDVPLDYIETQTETLPITDGAGTFAADGLDIDTLVVYESDGTTAATITTDYTAAYSGGTLTVTLVAGGSLAEAESVKITIDQAKTNLSISDANAWANDHGYTSGVSDVCWPQVEDGSGRVFHISTLRCVEYMRCDAQHEDVPFESPDNKPIPAVKLYFGEGRTGYFDNEEADILCKNSICTAISWGGAFVLWGPHSAAYAYGAANADPQYIFGSTIRMLFHLLNGFQRRHLADIGRPLTLRKVQEIMNEENNEYKRYKALGALLGDAEILFLASENSTSDMMNGDFTWSFDATPTPPLKSATLGVAYSDAGFEAYFDFFAKEAS